jgi:hypothetical protein
MGPDEQSTLLQQVARNAFRVLGLPADAPQETIFRRAEELKRAATAEIRRSFSWDIERYGPVQRDRGSISDAVGRLSNPRQRLRERLFWTVRSEPYAVDSPQQRFDSPTSTWQGSLFPADHHDAAVFALASCFLTDIDVHDADDWGTTLQMWADLLESEDFWSGFFDTEEAGDFEPAASLEDIDELRDCSHQLAIAPLAELARDAAFRSEFDCCRRALGIIRTAPFASEIVSAAEESVLGPYEDALVRTSKVITRACWDDIRQDRASAEWNATASSVAVDRWKQDVEPRYGNLIAMTGASSDRGLRVRQEYADFLTSLGNALTWADQWVEAEKLLKLALSCLPPDSPTRVRDEERLLSVGREAARQREKELELRKQADIEGFEHLCEEIATCLLKVANPAAVHAMPEIDGCKEAHRRYKNTVLPWLSIIRAAHSETSPHALRARTAAARCLLGIADRFRYCGDRCKALDLLAPAAELAPTGSETASEIARQRADLYRESSSRSQTAVEADRAGSVDGFVELCNSIIVALQQFQQGPGSKSSGGNLLGLMAEHEDYRRRASPWLAVILKSYHGEMPARAGNAAARCLSCLAGGFMSAHDWDTAQTLAQQALPLIEDEKLEAEVKRQLANIAAHKQKTAPRPVITNHGQGTAGQTGAGNRMATAKPPRAPRSLFRSLGNLRATALVVGIALLVILASLSSPRWENWIVDLGNSRSRTEISVATPSSFVSDPPPTGAKWRSVDASEVDADQSPPTPRAVKAPRRPAAIDSDASAKQFGGTSEPTTQWTIVPARPLRASVSLPNGTELIPPLPSEASSELQVSNHTTQDAVVKLKAAANKETLRSVYVKAMSDFTIPKIVAGVYLVEFATGMDWDEASRSFRQDRGFARFGNPLAFSEDQAGYSANSITLHTVANGNARKQTISAEEFGDDSGTGGVKRPRR